MKNNKINRDMKKARKWILLAILTVVVAGVFMYLWKQSRPKEVKYETKVVAVGTIQKTTIVTGKIEPRDEVEIKPQISGIITELYKQAGDKVRVGDAIAKIKVIPDMAQLNSAESRVRLAKYNLENSHQVFERDSMLLAQEVIAHETYEKSRLQYISNLEELQAAEDHLSITRDGVAKKAETDFTNTIVKSTITGTVLDVPVKVGNSVVLTNTFNDGTTIATVADMQDLLFVGSIDETEVGKLREGMRMDLVIGALNDQRFTATLEYIAPKGTEQNGAMMFEIKGAATIPDTVIIRAGYSANAEIVLNERVNVLTIPEANVEMEDDKSFVQLITDTTTQAVTRTEIQTGLSDGLTIEVTEGLKAGDMIRGNQITQ
jgi:HlyD family secretion protein